MAIIAMKKGHEMRSVKVAELKKSLSKCLTFCQRRARGNFPVAKLVPFIRKDASEQDLLLVAVGKMRLPQIRLDMKKLSKTPTGSVKGTKRSKRSLAIWGTNDVFLVPAGAEAYRRDNPNATVRLLDTGHFALETHVEEIAKAMHEVLGRAGR